MPHTRRAFASCGCAELASVGRKWLDEDREKTAASPING
jgi:hypothetical protein